MDKRYEASKDYGRINKKPKLEIIVNKGRPNQNSAGAPGTSRYTAKPASPPRSSPDDFWDDDDDEVLLMASQVVEKSAAQTIPSTNQNKDFTFSEFAANSKATSTQKYFEQDLQLFSEMDDDWDAPAAPPVEKPSVFLPTQRNNPNEFKVPGAVAPAAVKRTHQESERSERPFSSDLPKSATPLLGQLFPSTQGNFSNTPISLSQPSGVPNKNSNREKAHECQIQFLQKRADTLKKENAKITKELDEFRNKMESKDGEVSLLRDEIRHLKQQIQNAQREKLQSTDSVKTEWQEKINELAKQVEAQQTVLEFKTMEISKLKMNHGDESMRFDNSMRDSLNETVAQQANLRITTINRRRMTQIQSSMRVSKSVPTMCHIPIEIFDQSTEKGNSKLRKDVFNREMERLQFHMSRVQYIGQLKVTKRTELAENVIESAKCVIAEFWTYVHSLEYNKHNHSLPHHFYDITKDNRQQSNRCSLFQAQALFPNEKAINLRRYIAGLSVICKLLPETGALLFSKHHNDYLLIQIIVDGLNKLGFSQEICQHFGLIEAFAMLLDSLWNNHSDEEQYQEHLMSFLKTLIFCRPNAWASKFISLCLQKLSPYARDQLCSNVRSPNFTVSQAVYKFTSESCVLQVYACLLETAFPANQELKRNEFKLLAEICYNHLNFFTSCFPSPPRFLAQILPHDDDLDDDGGGGFIMMTQQMVANVKCQCYVMMCSSVVKLLYQVMRQWQRMERQHEVKLIENIAKVGVRLLHTIYIRYYMTKLFDHKGYLTRHYLYFICKYWLESSDLLQFKETHREALDQLASSHIVEIKSPPEERNTSKVDRDLKRWYEHSGDVRSDAMDCTDLDAENLTDFMKLRITEKTCKPETFFKRY